MVSLIHLCLALCVSNGETPVRLEPGVQTLGQIVHALSAQGVSASCDTTIGNRMALVRLKPRPWSALRPLLEKGLEVQFREQPDHTWKLTADVEAAEHERRLHNTFVARYEGGVTSFVSQAWNAADAIAALDKPERDRQREALDAILRDKSASQQVRYQAGLTEELESNGEKVTMLRIRQPFNFGHLIAQPAFFSYTGADLFSDTFPDAAFLRAGIPNVLYTSENAPPTPLKVHWVEHLSFDPIWLRLTGDCYVFSDANLGGNGTRVSDLVPGYVKLSFTLRDVFREASQNEALLRREKTTSDWLRAPEANKPLTLGPGKRTLSAFVQQWSQTHDREVVMEVSALRDILPGVVMLKADQTMPLSHAFDSGHLPGKDDPDDNASAFDQTVSEEGRTVVSATRTVDATGIPIDTRLWTASELDGVALIHNEMSFLDNAVPQQTAAAVFLAARRDKSETHLLTINDLLAASRLLTARENARSAVSTLYNGLGQFAEAYPFLRLLDTSPDRQATLKTLLADGKVSIDCRTFDRAQLNALTTALREITVLRCANGFNSAIPFYADFASWVRRATFTVEAFPTGFGKCVWLKFTLHHNFSLVYTEKPNNPIIIKSYLTLGQATVGPLLWLGKELPVKEVVPQERE